MNPELRLKHEIVTARHDFVAAISIMFGLPFMWDVFAGEYFPMEGPQP